MRTVTSCPSPQIWMERKYGEGREEEQWRLGGDAGEVEGGGGGEGSGGGGARDVSVFFLHIRLGLSGCEQCRGALGGWLFGKPLRLVTSYSQKEFHVTTFNLYVRAKF